MQLIIDGHNLIPHLPGINLSDLDDEEKLISWLMRYCRIKRSKALVFFDQAPPGLSGVRSHGAVKAHFVRQGRTADDAIKVHINKLGRAVRNYTVVSSDRMVVAAARSLHAEVMSSDAFAKELMDLSEPKAENDPGSKPLSPEEVEDWERLFKTQKRSKKYSK